MILDDLPPMLYVIRRIPEKRADGTIIQPTKLSLVLGETSKKTLVLFAWPTLAGLWSWQLVTKIPGQGIEIRTTDILELLGKSLQTYLIYFDAPPGETNFTDSNKLISIIPKSRIKID